MTSDDDLCARVDRLEQRLRSVEDELEITRTVVEYGLAVDSGEAEATGQLFTEDTVFDVDGDNIMRGRTAVEAMVLGRGHQSLLPNCAHTIGPIVVQTNGDSALATGYSRIYRATGDSFGMDFAAAPGNVLVPGGICTNAQRAVFRSAGHPGELPALGHNPPRPGGRLGRAER